MAAPPKNAIARVRKNAPQYGSPWWVIRAQAMNVQNMPISPWAKLTIPVARWISTSASASVA